MEELVPLAILALLAITVALEIAILLRRPPSELSAASVRAFGDDVGSRLATTSTTVLAAVGELGRAQKSQLDGFAEGLGRLTQTNEQKLEALRFAVDARLAAIQQDSAAQLERMRQTVDEKLQGTLEARLGESFRQVSERLEKVAEGLGEMRTLASGVGDLKKVLTNVKTRGTWGEVQLGAMLEEVLSPQQYERNVATRGGPERVEFAVRFPGRGDGDEPCWLPIDAKFPIEDWQRLVDAQELGDLEAVDAAGRQLETRIKLCAKEIATKYLSPPLTTEFAILFLPTEGLFAEVLRRPGLADQVQREWRVVLAGPTTLWSILSSLQMGFRSLAIEKSSSEVWNLLSAVKTEWTRYGDLLGKVRKKLGEATGVIDQVEQRSRMIGRKLANVQSLDAPPVAIEVEPAGADEDGDREPAEELRSTRELEPA